MKKNNIVTLYNVIINVLLIIVGILLLFCGNEVLQLLQDESLEGIGMGGALIFLIIAIVSIFFYAIGAVIILVSIISLIILCINFTRNKRTTKGVFIYHIVIFSIYLFNVFTFFPTLFLESGFNIIALIIMLPFLLIFGFGIVLNSFAVSRYKENIE